MNYIQTDIPGVMILEPKVFGDSRGYFFESFSQREFDAGVVIQAMCASANGDISPQYSGENGICFVQDNESRSRYGVLRGLHFQRPPFAQSKLVRVATGRVLDVAVDIRKGSPTYGRSVSVELSAENHRTLFLPRGMAHGCSVLSDDVIFQYKCDNLYCPDSEGALAWDDPDLAIDWRIPADKVILSEKDQHHPSFATYLKSL